HLNLRLNNAPADAWRKAVVNWTWRIKVLLHLETELMGTVRERAEDEAINVLVVQVFRKDDYAVKYAVEPLLSGSGPLGELSVRLKLMYGLGVIVATCVKRNVMLRFLLI
ncbi:hypothetical protein ISX56_34390, partial [Serratia ureilytica]|nr:hypothetical protein [Serratia ureilytica]